MKLEETPEADPTEVSEIAAAINIPVKTAASAGESEIATYELEDEDEFDEELAFIIFCKIFVVGCQAMLMLDRFL